MTFQLSDQDMLLFSSHKTAERILQMALEEDDECVPTTLEPENKLAALQAAVKNGPSFFQAIDIKRRPIAPFINRPKLPRAHRQKCLDKLTGQHLALAAALADPEMSPENAAADATLLDQSITSAVEQEADIYNRCSSGQLYQNLAARSSALDWRSEIRAEKDAEKAYATLLQTQSHQEQEESAPRLKKKRKIDVDNNNNSANYRQFKTSTADPRSSVSNEPTSLVNEDGVGAQKNKISKSQPQLLVEADLDWDNAKPSNEDAIALKEVRRRVLNILEICCGWNTLTPEEKITAANRCTDKIDGKPCSDEALQRLGGEYIRFLLKKRKFEND